MQHKLISLTEAAEMLGLTPKTLRNWKSDNELPFPYYKIGGRVKFKLSELEQYVENNRIPTKEEIEKRISITKESIS